MKISVIIYLGVMAYLALMTQNSSGDENVRRIFQSILTRLEYLSLDHKSQHQIIIAFFHILKNPIKYGAIIKTIAENFKSKPIKHNIK
jgi:hypothetical protein